MALKSPTPGDWTMLYVRAPLLPESASVQPRLAIRVTGKPAVIANVNHVNISSMLNLLKQIEKFAKINGMK